MSTRWVSGRLALHTVSLLHLHHLMGTPGASFSLGVPGTSPVLALGWFPSLPRCLESSQMGTMAGLKPGDSRSAVSTWSPESATDLLKLCPATSAALAWQEGRALP